MRLPRHSAVQEVIQPGSQAAMRRGAVHNVVDGNKLQNYYASDLTEA